MDSLPILRKWSYDVQLTHRNPHQLYIYISICDIGIYIGYTTMIFNNHISYIIYIAAYIMLFGYSTNDHPIFFGVNSYR